MMYTTSASFTALWLRYHDWVIISDSAMAGEGYPNQSTHDSSEIPLSIALLTYTVSLIDRHYATLVLRPPLYPLHTYQHIITTPNREPLTVICHVIRPSVLCPISISGALCPIINLVALFLMMMPCALYSNVIPSALSTVIMSITLGLSSPAINTACPSQNHLSATVIVQISGFNKKDFCPGVMAVL